MLTNRANAEAISAPLARHTFKLRLKTVRERQFNGINLKNRQSTNLVAGICIRICFPA